MIPLNRVETEYLLSQALTRFPGLTRDGLRLRREVTFLPGTIAVKLADRFANVKSCWDTRDTRLFMYWREYPEFRAALYSDADTALAPLWGRLDRALDWQDRR